MGMTSVYHRHLLERDGFCIRRSKHPLYWYGRLPQGKLPAELDLIFFSLMELVDGRYAESWQLFCQRLEAAQAAPVRQAFTWD